MVPTTLRLKSQRSETGETESGVRSHVHGGGGHPLPMCRVLHTRVNLWPHNVAGCESLAELSHRGSGMALFDGASSFLLVVELT